MRLTIALFIILFGSAAAGAPCDGIDSSLSTETKVTLAPVIAKQLQTTTVDVLSSLKSGAWTILYVNPHDADQAFLFYSGDPLTSRYVTLWAGAATRDEESSIRKWVQANAPGAPSPLARCFAWYVTKGRAH
jgi:2-C-methyl-D-erythritol 4-phosphate cytidylyltransferase